MASVSMFPASINCSRPEVRSRSASKPQSELARGWQKDRFLGPGAPFPAIVIGFPPGAEFELLGARLTILVWTVVGGDVAGEGGVVADTESDEESDGEEAEGVEDKEVVDRVGSLDVLVVISVVTVVIVVLMVVVEGCAGVMVEIIIGNIGVLSVDVGEICIDVVESEVLEFVPNISLIRSIGIV